MAQNLSLNSIPNSSPLLTSDPKVMVSCLEITGLLIHLLTHTLSYSHKQY